MVEFEWDVLYVPPFSRYAAVYEADTANARFVPDMLGKSSANLMVNDGCRFDEFRV